MTTDNADREFVNFLCGGLRFGLAKANATAASSLMAKAQQTQLITIEANSRLDAGYHRQGDNL